MTGTATPGSGTTTKYRSAHAELLERLEQLGVGDALPAERTLAADLGVSRMTLRRAVDELVREGRLVRRQGAGTFVAAPKIAASLHVSSFSEDMRRRGHVPHSRTVAFEEMFAGPQLGRRLDVSPGARVLRVERLRLADEAPMAIETLHVPTDLVPGLSGEDLVDASFYELLSTRHGIVLARGLQEIEPTVTDERESALLEVPLHSPAFLFERTSWDGQGRTVEFVRSVYRGDRYRLTAELRPDGAAPGPGGAA
ncbi:GntR family transcriptional regulator [Egicoccus halophilus]|uniref:Transcriptional regulator n=1 Tax=Egicoccus halophilus TaxID=1670830 RepID=A0A8J3EVM1_9ACTN|nr:GntR family transcriptional regulator [Egicoccus halophilus]GGI08404.1 transcriptional regulator [Egicoccus halophilus]